MHAPHAATRSIYMLVYAGGQSLDVCGPLEVFSLANRQAAEADPDRAPLYSLHVLAASAQPVRMDSGLRLLPDLTCAQMPDGAHTLLVSGGMGDALDRARADRELVAWLRHAVTKVTRVATVCSGALLLAETGALDGRKATTHWLDVAELKRRYPEVLVVADAIYICDGGVWTSAGITAGMDLALAMVAADHGQALALKVAKRMVMVSKRSGGQSQFSGQLDALDLPDPFAQLAEWIGANLHAHLDAARLAQRLHMSARQFGRRFHAAFSTTPQKYVERRRVDAAKPLLESTRKSLKRIAADCGFASDEALRRAFLRQLGVSPSDYRQRFSAP